MTPLVAALLAGATVTLLVPPRPARSRSSGPAPATAQTELRGLPALLLAAAVVAVLVMSVSVTHTVLIAAVALLATGLRRRAAGRRCAREAAERRAKVVELTEALAAELGAGASPVAAIGNAAATWPEAQPVARAAELGAEVPTVLRRLGDRPGAEGLHRLAAAWELTVSSGAGLAQASLRVLETARVREAAARRVEAEVASARATVALVSALPVVVLLGAQSTGAAPFAFLTGHPVGVGCTLGGLALWWLGTGWIERIAADAVSGVT